jgi:hypothetical protein
MVRRGGRVCLAGFLGGGEPIAFNPLLQMPSGVDLSFFGFCAPRRYVPAARGTHGTTRAGAGPGLSQGT